MPTFASVMLRILKENDIDFESDIIKIITPLGYHATKADPDIYKMAAEKIGKPIDEIRRIADYYIHRPWNTGDGSVKYFTIHIKWTHRKSIKQ